MRHHTGLLSLWFMAVSAGACGSDGGSVEQGGDAGANDTDSGFTAVEDPSQASSFADFDRVIEDFLSESGLTGASAIIVHREEGVLHHQGYGAFDKDRIYAIASSSKVLSVGILMRLQDQGLLDVDEPIGSYLEELFGAGKPELTVAQLVSNSSGLTSLLENPTYGPYICQYLEAGTLTDCAKAIYTADDAMDRVEPDTRFSYGGGPWQLSGGVAEVVSGKSWAELVDETYAPCGVTTLGYTNPFQQYQTNYPMLDGDPANAAVTNNPNIEGGAYVSMSDYAAILLMHLRGGMCDGGQALSLAAVERMRQDRIAEAYDGSTGAAGALEGYGLGWWIDRDQEGFFADGGAYGATAWLDLSRDYAGFVALEATSTEGRALFAKLQPVVESVIDAR